MWPFSRRTPAPPPVVHPLDQGLVRPADAAWWSRQSMQSLNSMLSQDHAFFVAIIRDRMADGMSDEDAAREAFRWAPTYYLREDGRTNELAASDDDMPLPAVLKDRVVRANTSPRLSKRLKAELSSCTSANAWFRAAIRNGEI